MKKLKSIYLKIAARFAPPQRTSSILVVALAVVAAAGGLWMIVDAGRPEQVPVSTAGSSPEHLAQAARHLQDHGVPCQIRGGQLNVSADHLSQARALLAESSAVSEMPAAATDDLWLTRSASEQRRLAARLATLGRLIGQFPDVESAVVLYEPPASARIGQVRPPATAAVHVRMRGDSVMTQRLVHAVADLVTGGISGLKPRDVCVIDHRGRSYRPDEQALAEEAAAETRAALAADCEARVRKALAHIDGLTVVASVSETDPPRCLAARVSVPWQYYQAVAQRGHSDLLAVSVGESMRIRRTVADLLNVEEFENVVVDIHRDLTLNAPVAEAESQTPAARTVSTWLAGAMAFAGMICAIAAVRRRRRMHARPTPRETRVHPPLAALEDLTDEDLIWLLAAERPQTIAVVVRNLPRKRAGAVLASFERPQQRLIVQQLSDLEKVPAETVDAIVASLGERLAAMRQTAGAKATVAELVQHWDARSGEGPEASADRRALEFEDIVDVPGAILAPALARLDVRMVAVALRTAGESVRQRMFQSLGRRRTRHVRKQMDRIGPVRLGDVEAAQDRVAQAVRMEITTASPRLMDAAS